MFITQIFIFIVVSGAHVARCSNEPHLNMKLNAINYCYNYNNILMLLNQCYFSIIEILCGF